ncbi:MAG: hypothetical protein R2719_08660 [Micropruina sp.]
MASTLRRLCVAACAPLVLALAGCGMNVQTLQPYTPAQGVNSDVGQVRVRNLVIVADAAGQGVISASLITYADDTLTAVGGTPHKSDGSAGSPLVVTATGLPLQLSTETLVVLTEARSVRGQLARPEAGPARRGDHGLHQVRPAHDRGARGELRAARVPRHRRRQVSRGRPVRPRTCNPAPGR